MTVRSSLKTLFVNLLTLTIALVLFGLLAEVAVRVLGIGSTSYYQPDRVMGYPLAPNADYMVDKEGYSRGRINSRGLRDHEYPYDKPARTRRVLVLGDSFVEGLQVDLDSSFVKILERTLNARGDSVRYEAINAGRSGMGTTDEYLWYVSEGRKYRPDLVLLSFYMGKDFRDNSRELTRRAAGTFRRPFFLLSGDSLEVDSSFVRSRRFILSKCAWVFTRHSQLAALVVQRIILITRGDGGRASRSGTVRQLTNTDLGVFGTIYDDEWRGTVEVTRRALARLATNVRGDCARLVLVGIPDAAQVEPETRTALARSQPDLDFSKPDSLLASMASGCSIPYISLTPCLQERRLRDGRPVYGFGVNLGNGHWNGLGQAAAAEFLAQEIWSLLGEE